MGEENLRQSRGDGEFLLPLSDHLKSPSLRTTSRVDGVYQISSSGEDDLVGLKTQRNRIGPKPEMGL